MNIQLTKTAFKDLKKIPPPRKHQIIKAIDQLVGFPNVSHVKKLTNFTPSYRMRVGDYRVLFDAQESTILIGRVLHRKHSYQK
jgi:mRNA interferase RelE/StbE